jgi:hypothetical protein
VPKILGHKGTGGGIPPAILWNVHKGLGFSKTKKYCWEPWADVNKLMSDQGTWGDRYKTFLGGLNPLFYKRLGGSSAVFQAGQVLQRCNKHGEPYAVCKARLHWSKQNSPFPGYQSQAFYWDADVSGMSVNMLNFMTENYCHLKMQRPECQYQTSSATKAPEAALIDTEELTQAKDVIGVLDTGRCNGSSRRTICEGSGAAAANAIGGVTSDLVELFDSNHDPSQTVPKGHVNNMVRHFQSMGAAAADTRDGRPNSPLSMHDSDSSNPPLSPNSGSSYTLAGGTGAGGVGAEAADTGGSMPTDPISKPESSDDSQSSDQGRLPTANSDILSDSFFDDNDDYDDDDDDPEQEEDDFEEAANGNPTGQSRLSGRKSEMFDNDDFRPLSDPEMQAAWNSGPGGPGSGGPVGNKRYDSSGERYECGSCTLGCGCQSGSWFGKQFTRCRNSKFGIYPFKYLTEKNVGKDGKWKKTVDRCVAQLKDMATMGYNHQFFEALLTYAKENNWVEYDVGDPRHDLVW